MAYDIGAILWFGLAVNPICRPGHSRSLPVLMRRVAGTARLAGISARAFGALADFLLWRGVHRSSPPTYLLCGRTLLPAGLTGRAAGLVIFIHFPQLVRIEQQAIAQFLRVELEQSGR